MHGVYAVSKLVSQVGSCIGRSGISIECQQDQVQEAGAPDRFSSAPDIPVQRHDLKTGTAIANADRAIESSHRILGDKRSAALRVELDAIRDASACFGLQKQTAACHSAQAQSPHPHHACWSIHIKLFSATNHLFFYSNFHPIVEI